MVIELAINSQADNDTGLTYGQIIESDGINAGQVIPYGPDMYRQALPIILKHGYAVASDPDGKNSTILKLQGGTYAHRYRYDGGVDMWFLNSYDCIFLYDCNEFSVELCRTALGEWTGKRLVLVGSKWERMIEYLDDIDGVECFYEPEPDDSRFTQLMEGYRCLHVIDGLPHQESMDRYNDGIMYYEEVMSFTYMFSDYRSLGSLNPDKKFFVIDGYYNKLGLFTIFSKIVTCAKYVKAKGMVPVVRLTMSGNSFYSDFEGDDIWSKFFNQPEGYTLEEVIHSANVYFSPGFYNGNVQSTIMENIRYGKLDATDEEVIAAAKAAHAHHFIETLPGGYNMELNEDASNVSQGQKQLLTIARAILADNPILILDEATSSVDTRTEIQIQNAMDNLMKGRTSFVIAHRLSTIKDADIILVMKEGDIVEQGNHEELLAKGGFYADLYNSQFEDVVA